MGTRTGSPIAFDQTLSQKEKGWPRETGGGGQGVCEGEIKNCTLIDVQLSNKDPGEV